jgi:putative thioredoxin
MSSSSFNRPGAVDLSQLAAKAQQSAPGGRARYVLEVTERSFEAEVIRRSLKHPVVVELYSPRVSNGKQLSDTLAALADEAAGKYLVARLNVDTAPQIVQALGLQAVPTVVGVFSGQLAPLFQGVLPREQVAAAIEQLLKAAVTSGVVGRAEPVTQSGEADTADTAADPRFAAADAALERGDYAAAEAEFDKLLQTNPQDAEAKAGKAQAGLLARTAKADPSQVLARAQAPGASLEDHLAAADVEVALGRAEEAFARLINLVREGEGADRDRARTRLLELFETLGNTDPRVLKARRDLMAALF